MGLDIRGVGVSRRRIGVVVDQGGAVAPGIPRPGLVARYVGVGPRQENLHIGGIAVVGFVVLAGFAPDHWNGLSEVPVLSLKTSPIVLRAALIVTVDMCFGKQLRRIESVTGCRR